MSEESRREPQYQPDEEEEDDIEAGEIVAANEVEEPTGASELPAGRPPSHDILSSRIPNKTVSFKEEHLAVEDQDEDLPDFDRSSEEDEDENIVFTQDYLEERKRIFEKDMKALRADMPPPPLEDSNIVALLLKIQLLGTIATNVATEMSPDQASPADAAKGPTENVAAPVEAKLEKKPEDQEPLTKVVLESIPATEMITVDSLPFLTSGPPTPISDLEVWQENAASYDTAKIHSLRTC